MGQMAGILGICSQEDCLQELFEGAFQLQHRGQEYCGLATSDGERIKIRTHRGLVIPTFENDLLGLEGSWGIGHVSSFDRQPLERHANFGQFIIGFDGHLTNSAVLREELFTKGCSFSSLKDIELIAALIGQEESVEKGLEEMLQRIEGPCSLTLLTRDGIYVARDRQGFRPLVLGKSEKGWIVASESCGFPNETTERIRDVEPGEILFINQTGISSLRKLEGTRKHCSFEWIYYALPDSVIEGISVTEVRHRLGRFLAQEDNVEADLVGAVPFSGCSHAEGYHLQSRLPHLEVFLPPRYLGRTYMRPEVELRKREKKRKLTPLTVNVLGKRVVLVDDSIRSGITSQGLVGLLKQAGAAKVHVRIASPPSIRYCPQDRPPEEEERFIASTTRTLEEIRQFIRADTLRFQKLKNVPRAIGLPQDSLCLDCFLSD